MDALKIASTFPIDQSLLQHVKDATSARSYVDNIVKPFIDSQKVRINLDKNITHPFEQFITDTYFIVQQGMSSKRIPTAVFDNGVLSLKDMSVSNWDVGFNKVQDMLHLNTPGSMILMQSKIGTALGYTSKLSREMDQQMQTWMAKGSFLDPVTSEVLKNLFKVSSVIAFLSSTDEALN